MTLARTCCCEGCTENDSCPVFHTGLGDFTYQITVDQETVAGNFALQAVTDVRTTAMVGPDNCYAFGYIADKCCFTGPNCEGPNSYLVEKYFNRMLVPEVIYERTNFPCYTVISSGKAFPGVVVQKRCSVDRTVEGKACFDVGTSCADLFPGCYQGPAPNYLTELGPYKSAYAGDPNNQLCGDFYADFYNPVTFEQLTVGSGTIRARRNGSTAFLSDVISGSGITEPSYLHRVNICQSTNPFACGPCTISASNVACYDGRCCCRSLFSYNFEVKRAYRINSFAWNSAAATFTLVPSPILYWTQTVRVVYEGPVDERLYGVTGTSAVRTFTLLSATIFDTIDSGPSPTVTLTNLDFCAYDLLGLPGTFGNGFTDLTGTFVDDECVPCVPPTPEVPNRKLSLEQAERLGMKRSIIVTRVTP